jgi:hypothetical protein
MSVAGEPCGARFFDTLKQDLGRAVQVTTRLRKGPTLTVLDVAGAEPGLVRALVLLDRSHLRIHWEDAARTCYVFRWASGYSNGCDVRIQGVLEASTGHELDGWTARPAVPVTTARVDSGKVASWNPRRARRPW